jgi:hypothetical protein
VGSHVNALVRSWGSVVAIAPERFIAKLMISRGYACDAIPALCASERRMPSEQQTTDYDAELADAVRRSDLDKLQKLYEGGRWYVVLVSHSTRPPAFPRSPMTLFVPTVYGCSMTACNRYSESILHMACRRSEYAIVDFIIRHGGDCNIVDDFGRTPLHDACWRVEPRFDIVTLLLDHNLDLLRVEDVRGASPLKYIREEHWLQWCAYLYHQKDNYWPHIGDPATNLDKLRKFTMIENSHMST